MEYILILFLIVILGFLKLLYDEKKYRKQLIFRLEKEWGEIPTQEYTAEKFKSLQYYYNTIKDNNLDVDDITWNDTDMDQIFMLMNNTSSTMGEEYLYSVLRKLKFDSESLQERNRLVDFFEQNPDKRLKIQLALGNIGKLSNISLYEYINRTDNLDKDNTLKHYLCIVGLLGAISLIFIPRMLGLGIVATVFFVVYNMITYYKRKAEIEKYINVLSHILKVLNSTKKVASLDIPEIKQYTDSLKTSDQSFQKFKSGSFFVVGGRDMGGNITDFILDYLRMLFHVDLIKFDSMLQELRKNKDVLNQIYEAVGTLDSMIAVASFRKYMGVYSLPQLEESVKPFLKVEEVYHPLIDEPVKNSIDEHKCVLITGSNASGKSTFIKTLAINTILSQTIYTSLSKSYHASFFKVYSSMALKDDLFSQESYYIVEIKSLKRILDQVNSEIPMLCFVDEVLRGTNTLERIAASSQILNSFARTNTICFAATHDIELTHILEKFYSNYHFQEQIINNDILFDYIIYKGRAISRNAIKLLGIMGYKEAIIQQATEEANSFLENGTWRVFH